MKKILIVDDNELIAEIMTFILSNKGYEVSTLDNGDEVIGYVRAQKPDLMLLDDNLPGITGTEICKILRTEPDTQYLPIIMCSGNDCISAAMDHPDAPNDFLQKPFDMDALLNKVSYQLAA